MTKRSLLLSSVLLAGCSLFKFTIDTPAKRREAEEAQARFDAQSEERAAAFAKSAPDAFTSDTSDGVGRPTPEGAHRDGVDFVAVILVDRHGIKGGETRVFQADGPDGQRFTLLEPWSMLFLDDARVIHESTPIQPASDDTPGHRDTLVLTFRAGAFQGDD